MNKILSYNELNECINDSKYILNDCSLDYLESLLNHEISVLDKDNNFLGEYLCQLKFFKDLFLYNLYMGSLDLVNTDKKDYIKYSELYNRFNIDFVKNNVRYNIYSLDYRKDIFNISLYSNSFQLFNNNIDDYVLKYVEDDMIISSERDRILSMFLVNNNLKLSDFDTLEKVKVKKYPYANIYIK